MSRAAPRIRIVVNLLGTVAIIGLLVAERHRPLRRQRYAVLPRTIRNVTMGTMCAAVVSTIEVPLTQAVARSNESGCRGIAHVVPARARCLVAFLAMDYGFYLWHVVTHRVPQLWRLHRIHHVDPDMDASTAIRFHMLDMLVSLPWRLIQVRVSGITPGALDAWQRFFQLSILFHHANLALPGEWDRWLSLIFTTPRMHGIHHSAVPAERDSNWSSGISLWDHLHGSFRALPPPREIVIGVDDPCMMADVPIEAALRAPFVRG